MLGVTQRSAGGKALGNDVCVFRLSLAQPARPSLATMSVFSDCRWHSLLGRHWQQCVFRLSLAQPARPSLATMSVFSDCRWHSLLGRHCMHAHFSTGVVPLSPTLFIWLFFLLLLQDVNLDDELLED